MKSFITASAALISAVSAHSWLECTNHDNSQIRDWMQGNSTLTPPVLIDPTMPAYAYLCHGWPRGKNNPGDWIDESTNYLWNLAAKKFEGDSHACSPLQRTPNQKSNAPIASAAPGSTITLRYGGNGHARGKPQGEIGTVSVFWKGKPEQEFSDQKEFTKDNLLATAGFSDDSFSYPANPAIVSPTQGLVDKGNWMKVKLPDNMAPGRHAMVWTWSYDNQFQWSTCFDVNVSGGSGDSYDNSRSPAPAQSAPAAPAAKAPAAVVPAPAPAPAQNYETSPAPSAAPVPSPAPASSPAPAPAAPAAASPPAAPAAAEYSAPAPAPASSAAAPVADAVAAAAPSTVTKPKACKAKKPQRNGEYTYGGGARLRRRRAHQHHL